MKTEVWANRDERTEAFVNVECVGVGTCDTYPLEMTNTLQGNWLRQEISRECQNVGTGDNGRGITTAV